MVLTKAKDERILREGANISVNILNELKNEIKEGVTPLQIDTVAGELCNEYGVIAAFTHVNGYEYNTCISVNNVAVHGIPNTTPLKKGDLVSIDFGIIFKNMYTDHCWTWSIGKASEDDRKLLDAGREAVQNALTKAVVGNHTGDLGCEMESTAKKYGFNILKMFVGHGIGKSLHEGPDIPAFGKKGKGALLVDGMVICIECQVVNDTGDIKIDRDGWSAKTKNGGKSVMFEYMGIVREDRFEVLTDTFNWKTEV